MSKTDPIILSLGGSLIYPREGIDVTYLRELNGFIRKHVAEGRRFFIVCGGGNIARHYQNIGKNIVSSLTSSDVDWLGIHATRINAHLVRTIFSDIAHERVIDNYEKKIEELKEPVVIAGGWKPGWSTDYCATLLAQDYGAKTIINMSNIDQLYTKDPNKYTDVKPIKEITWNEFEKYSGEKWTPGANVPFDPIAVKLANKLKLTVIITNGKNLGNLDNIIQGKPFKGTVIKPFTLDPSYFNKKYYHAQDKGKTSTLLSRLSRARGLYRAFLIKTFINPTKVLDVGCGLGFVVYYLRKFGIEAYGIDISDYAVEHALPSVKPYIKSGSILKIPFKDNSFDLITSFDALEHIPEEQLSAAIDECTRVSKKLQFHKIFTKDTNWLKGYLDRDPSHVSVLTDEWWKGLWSKKKLKVSFPWWINLPFELHKGYLLRK